MATVTTYTKAKIDALIAGLFESAAIDMSGHLILTTHDGTPIDVGLVFTTLDSDLTDIAALTPSANDILQFIAGHWANRTMAQLKTALAIAESDVSGLSTDLAVISSSLAGKQNLDSDLTAIAGLTPSANDILQFISGNWANQTMAQLKTALALAESDVSGLVTDLAGKQPLDSDLTTIAGLTPSANDFLEFVSGNWANRTPAQVKTALAIAESDVASLVSDLAAINSSLSSLGGTVSGALSDIAGLSPSANDVLQFVAGHWINHTMAQLKTALALAESDVSGLVSDLAGKQASNANLTTIAGLSPGANDFLEYVGGNWANRTPAQVKTTLAITESDVASLTTDLSGKQSSSAYLTDIAGLSPSANDILQYISGHWANRTMAQLKTALAIAESDVTNLTTDLAAKLAKAGGTMTGWLAPKVSTLTNSGSTVAVDASLGNSFALTLTASTWTISNPTNAVDGQVIRIRVIQDGTGSRTVAWDTAYDFGTSGAPTLTTTLNKVDIVAFEYVSSLSKWCYLGIGKGF